MMSFSPNLMASATLFGVLVSSSVTSWNLPNGTVEFDGPLIVKAAPMSLNNPELLGSGGGGAVFSMTPSNGVVPVAVKVSWVNSARSVRNECAILKVLKANNVRGVESCIASDEYPSDSRRALIVLEPVVSEESTSSIGDLVRKDLQITAAEQLMVTMIDMLYAKVATTDVQPLISTQTGSVLLIDMTEAKELLSSPMSYEEQALTASFCNEIMALIPEDLLPVASSVVLRELQHHDNPLPTDLASILKSMSCFSDELLAFLENSEVDDSNWGGPGSLGS